MSHWKDLIAPGDDVGRYLPWKEVAKVTGISRMTAWRMQQKGDFPAPYVISPGRVGYRQAEVHAWNLSRDQRGRAGSPAPKPPVEAAPPRVEQISAPAPAAEVVPPTPPGRASREKPPRRTRSEHAKAIAQQMLFDF